jgi:HEPN domain-containing protein
VVVTVPDAEPDPEPAVDASAEAPPPAVPAAVFVRRDFQPVFSRPEFLAANSAAAVAALCIMTAAFLRHRAGGVNAKLASIQKEQKALLESLKDRSTPDDEFFRCAIQYLVNLRRLSSRAPDASFLPDDLPSLAANEEAAARVREILSAYNELQYSGRRSRSFARDRETAIAFLEKPEGFFP